MRKIIVHCGTDYVGTDSYEALLVEDDTPKDQIDSIAYEMAVQHAESYFEEYNEEGDDAEYTDSIDASWEDYIPEVHDMHRAGGGSFEEDFKWLLGEDE